MVKKNPRKNELQSQQGITSFASDPNLQSTPPELGGVRTPAPPEDLGVQSFPNTNQTTSDIQQAVANVSAITGQPLVPNRVNKFFLPQGEVSREEFERAKGEAKITTQGGRSALNQGGGLLPETRSDLLDVNRETLTPEIQGALAGVGEDTFAGEEAISEQEVNTAGGRFVGATALLTLPSLLLKTAGNKSGTISLGRLAGAAAGIGTSRSIQRSKITEAKALTDSSKANIDDYVNAFKAGDMSYTDAVQQIQTEIMNIRRNEKTIKTLNQALGNWVAGGAEEAADIEQYIRHFNTIVYPDLVNSAQNRAVGIR